jgi:hypothetical protein
MKTEFTELTKIETAELNSENFVNFVFNSASLHLCG